MGGSSSSRSATKAESYNYYVPTGGNSNTVALAHSSGNHIKVTTTDLGAIKAGKDIALASIDSNALTANNALAANDNVITGALKTSSTNYANLLRTTNATLNDMLAAQKSQNVQSNQRLAQEIGFAQHSSESQGQAAMSQFSKLTMGIALVGGLMVVMKK